MKFTINGKEYTEFDINKRCAELMGKVTTSVTGISEYKASPDGYFIINDKECYPYAPCSNPSYTWPIIDKCWDELNEFVSGKQRMETKWIFTMQQHNCTKLVAACICFIELSEVA